MKGGTIPEDTFIKTTKTLFTLAPGQLKAKIQELAGMCICGTCPSYTTCAKDAAEGLFCAHGTSFRCITEGKGCRCPGCPVAKSIGLKYNAYCLTGSEKAQRFDAMLR